MGGNYIRGEDGAIILIDQGHYIIPNVTFPLELKVDSIMLYSQCIVL